MTQPGNHNVASTLVTMVNELMREKRRARRWKIFFWTMLGVLIGGGIWASQWQWARDLPLPGFSHVALVRMEGVLGDGTQAGNVNKALRSAFASGASRGVILYINSPGGSPVQAGYIYDEIRRLRERHADKPLFAVIADSGTSAAYYVAAAADTIYADRASVVGSIGVIYDSFGFVEAMRKLGIKRRLFTGGQHKGFLDPFLPLKQGEVRSMEILIEDVHRQFVNAVIKGRGERLQSGGTDLFNGLVWSGERALKLGLVDKLGDLDSVARAHFDGDNVVDYTLGENWLNEFGRHIVGMGRELLATFPALR